MKMWECKTDVALLRCSASYMYCLPSVCMIKPSISLASMSLPDDTSAEGWRTGAGNLLLPPHRDWAPTSQNSVSLMSLTWRLLSTDRAMQRYNADHKGLIPPSRF